MPWAPVVAVPRLYSGEPRAPHSIRRPCSVVPIRLGGQLKRLTPLVCRHTFASLMIAAGVNAKALSTFMGHTAISITLDLYGHLMPGSEAEAATLLDEYVTAQREAASERARGVGGELTGAQLGRNAQQPLA